MEYVKDSITSVSVVLEPTDITDQGESVRHKRIVCLRDKYDVSVYLHVDAAQRKRLIEVLEAMPDD